MGTSLPQLKTQQNTILPHTKPYQPFCQETNHNGLYQERRQLRQRQGQRGHLRRLQEANKEVAKDSNVDVSTRASAAKDALGDKADEHKHGASAEANKQRATH